MGGIRYAPAALSPGMTRYPQYKRLSGPQGQSERVRNVSPAPGFDSRTVEPVASRYTDHAIPAHEFQTGASKNAQLKWDDTVIH